MVDARTAWSRIELTRVPDMSAPTPQYREQFISMVELHKTALEHMERYFRLNEKVHEGVDSSPGISYFSDVGFQDVIRYRLPEKTMVDDTFSKHNKVTALINRWEEQLKDLEISVFGYSPSMEHKSLKQELDELMTDLDMKDSEEEKQQQRITGMQMMNNSAATSENASDLVLLIMYHVVL